MVRNYLICGVVAVVTTGGGAVDVLVVAGDMGGDVTVPRAVVVVGAEFIIHFSTGSCLMCCNVCGAIVIDCG